MTLNKKRKHAQAVGAAKRNRTVSASKPGKGRAGAGNAFDQRQQKRKFVVAGTKAARQATAPGRSVGAARAAAESMRKHTLGVARQQRGRHTTFDDRRIGEKDGQGSGVYAGCSE